MLAAFHGEWYEAIVTDQVLPGGILGTDAGYAVMWDEGTESLVLAHEVKMREQQQQQHPLVPPAAVPVVQQQRQQSQQSQRQSQQSQRQPQQPQQQQQQSFGRPADDVLDIAREVSPVTPYAMGLAVNALWNNDWYPGHIVDVKESSGTYLYYLDWGDGSGTNDIPHDHIAPIDNSAGAYGF